MRWLKALMLGVGKRLTRYRLRTFLVVVTLFCIFCGTLGREIIRVRHQQSTIEEIEALGGTVSYQGKASPVDPELDERSYKGWLRRHIDSNLFTFVDGVAFYQSIAAKDPINDDLLEVLLGLQYLKEVGVSGVKITDRSMKTLCKLPELTGVGLWHVDVTPDGLKMLGSIKGLDNISLHGSYLTDQHLTALSSFSDLSWLQLIDANRVTGEGLQHLGSLENLKALHFFKYSALDDDSSDFFLQLKNLKELSIVPGQVGDQTLFRICQLRRLNVLTLYNASISDRGATHLTRLTGLASLSLPGCAISDQSVSVIGQLKELQVLNLSGTQITDACVDDLLKLKNLQQLELLGTQLTTEGILQLTKLKKLEHLGVTADPEDVAKIERAFSQELPECHFYTEKRETSSQLPRGKEK